MPRTTDDKLYNYVTNARVTYNYHFTHSSLNHRKSHPRSTQRIALNDKHATVREGFVGRVAVAAAPAVDKCCLYRDDLIKNVVRFFATRITQPMTSAAVECRRRFKLLLHIVTTRQASATRTVMHGVSRSARRYHCCSSSVLTTGAIHFGRYKSMMSAQRTRLDAGQLTSRNDVVYSR